MSRYIAVDLGADSGRVILGTLEGGRLSLKPLHRFVNTPVRLPTGLYWDTLRLWHEILEGLAVAAREPGPAIEGIGVDTWGVDIAFLGADGALADNPRHYRDSRNNGMPEAAFAAVGKERIFSATGVQFMQINSLYQWYAMKLAASPALQAAKQLLFIPDIFNYFLTGEAKAERTIASTSQFYDPRRRGWARELVTGLGLDASILPEIVSPGTRLGMVLEYVADATGLPGTTPVYATAGHDTACAVAAVPAETGEGWCYISSGTWSLMGVELEEPVIDERSLEMNFTNEIGVEGRVRLLKNITGMWPLQECKRAWQQAGDDYSYEQLIALAADAEPFTAFIQPDAFLEPGHMPERIAAYCERSGQRAPAGAGAMTRVILESLALRYRQVLENLETLTEEAIRVIHIVGGGSQNRLLNQLVADCTGRSVVAGPVEATAAGNVLVQAMGAGQVQGLREAREIVRRSFAVDTYAPHADPRWESAYKRFGQLTEAAGA
ncbi:MAG: rhamnulokinase [Acidimicrobiia bacterium]|nr:rhamnulokinase [Acidimicrobiia bacterium]